MLNYGLVFIDENHTFSKFERLSKIADVIANKVNNIDKALDDNILHYQKVGLRESLIEY